MKIVILEDNTLDYEGDLDFSCFEKYGDVRSYPKMEREKLFPLLRDAEAVIGSKTVFDRQLLSAMPGLKYIGLFATGYNNVDIEYAKERGIVVTNVPDYSTYEVAQHTFALILYTCNKVHEYNEFVHSGGWTKSDMYSAFRGMTSLKDKTIGIVGYGSIGKRVAVIAESFGMNVLATSRTRQKGCDGSVRFVDQKYLLGNSDIVTMHCPLNSDTKGMCNEKFFSGMKNNAMFVNTSRGPVVDEGALIYALEHDIIGSAALDVVEKEPMSADSKLPGTKNLVITPHVAWSPLETRLRLLEITKNNFEKYLAGTPQNVIL